MFHNTHRQSTCERVPNTDKGCTKALLSDFSMTLRKVSWNISLLVVSEILGLFVNILTADGKNSQTLPKSARQHFFHIVSALRQKSS